MITRIFAALSSAALLLNLFNTDKADAAELLPSNVKRVLFLGDSITQNGDYCAMVETYMLTRQPQREIDFVNVGLGSETVSGLSEPNHANGRFERPCLHERLTRILERVKPDYVVACYGMNDGIYQDFDEQRFAAFQQGMTRLHDAVTALHVPILHLTPPVFDATQRKTPEQFDYDEVLSRYSKWLCEQRMRGWLVADLHGEMRSNLAEQRLRDPKFTFSRDAIHPDINGHWLMAKSILRALCASDLQDLATLNDFIAENSDIAAAWPIIRQREQITHDAWLWHCEFKRPDIKPGLPLSEAQKRSEVLLFQARALLTPSPWRSLFNGKDLAGWKANQHPDSWQVVDGSIRANAKPQTSHLFFIGQPQTEPFERFRNFVLEFETRAEGQSNSGLFFHTDFQASNEGRRLDTGYELQLNSMDNEKRKTGSLYDVVDLDQSPVKETEWFHVRLIVRGNRIMIQINDTTTVDYQQPASPTRKPDRLGRVLQPQGGAFALQAHDPKSIFYFRKIRVKSLL